MILHILRSPGPLHIHRLILETDGSTIASRVAMRTVDDGSPLAVDNALNVGYRAGVWSWIQRDPQL